MTRLPPEGIDTTGATSGDTLVYNATTDEYAPGSGGGGGGGGTGLLQVNAYNPGTLATYTTTSATDADVDATNMAVTFTVPTSGRVLVRLSAMTYNFANTLAHTWTIRSGSTTVAKRQQSYVQTGNPIGFPGSASFYITGLTAGASVTYKWGHFVDAGGNGRTYAGGAVGPAVMEVWEA